MNTQLKDLAKRPLRTIRTYPGYLVNGYKFHSMGHETRRGTMNSGVYIKGSNYCDHHENDYYGQLQEVVELEYPGWPAKQTVLFKCEWFDPTLNIGTRVHPKYNIVEVNHRRKFNKYERFVLAQQETQVYYCPYPSFRRDRADWWVVNKIKAQAIVEIPQSSRIIRPPPEAQPFQDDDMKFHAMEVASNEPMSLVNPNGAVIQIDLESKTEMEDESEFESELESDSEEPNDNDND